MNPFGLSLALVIVACGQARVGEQGPRPFHRSDTDALCAAAQTSKTTTSPRLFGSVQPDPARKATWKTYPAEDPLRKAVESGEVQDSAYLWKTEGGILVSLALTSASGDWRHYLEYCFRADGTLSRSISTLNTFNVYAPDRDLDPVSRERTRYFDACGKQVELQSKLLDLKTKRPAPERAGNFMDEDEPPVRRIDDLPFGRLLEHGMLPNLDTRRTDGCTCGH